MKSKEQIEAAATELVDSVVKVHKAFGPGLLESTYQVCLGRELRLRGFEVQTEIELPVVYEGLRIDAGYRIDMLVDGCIIVENKAVQELHPIHEAQLLTYLKLTRLPLGFLVNWNVVLVKNGIRRMVNNL